MIFEFDSDSSVWDVSIGDDKVLTFTIEDMENINKALKRDDILDFAVRGGCIYRHEYDIFFEDYQNEYVLYYSLDEVKAEVNYIMGG